MKKSERKPNDDAGSSRFAIRNFSDQDDYVAVTLVAQVIKKGRDKKNKTGFRRMTFGDPPVVVVESVTNRLSDTFFVWDAEEHTDEELAAKEEAQFLKKQQLHAVRVARLAREAAEREATVGGN